MIEDIPHNSTLQFDWVINFKEQEQDWMKSWGNISFFTYVRLRSQADLSTTGRSLRSIYPKFAPEGFRPNYPTLQAITDVYLYADFKNGKPTGSGRIEYVKIFAAVAIFILLIACMNFMNLATARASLRAKEIGIRKVSGAGKASLVGQFMTESLLNLFIGNPACNSDHLTDPACFQSFIRQTNSVRLCSACPMVLHYSPCYRYLNNRR